MDKPCQRNVFEGHGWDDLAVPASTHTRLITHEVAGSVAGFPLSICYGVAGPAERYSFSHLLWGGKIDYRYVVSPELWASRLCCLVPHSHLLWGSRAR